MKIRTLRYYLHETFVSIGRNTWMASASIGTVAVSLFVLGIFLLLFLNVNRIASTIESQVQIAVYLEDDLEQAEIRTIGSAIQKIDGIESLEFVSKDQAFAQLKQRLGDQSYLLDALDGNPLPNSFEIVMKNARLVPETARKISAIEGIEEVKYGRDVVDNLFEITEMVRVVGFMLVVLLTIATIFIISNTIRLTVFARRREIAIMKYVGATNRFIEIPFLLEGIILGSIGGVISAFSLGYFYALVSDKILESLTFFPLLPVTPYIELIGIFIILAGTVIGALGSTISLKRFLEV